jgi:hypothetical protein
MTIRINNHSPIPVAVDKVEIISTYKGNHFANASFKDLYIPANKVSQHSGYMVIDRGVVQNLIFKGIAEAFQGKSAGFDTNGLAATITIHSKVMGFIPFERIEELRGSY